MNQPRCHHEMNFDTGANAINVVLFRSLFNAFTESLKYGNLAELPKRAEALYGLRDTHVELSTKRSEILFASRYSGSLFFRLEADLFELEVRRLLIASMHDGRIK